LRAFAGRLFNAEKLSRRVGARGPLPPNEDVVRETLRVALPAIVETLSVAVIHMIDTYMVSNLGDYAISAVGLTLQPRFVMLAPFMALSIAVSALVARRRGEGRMDQALKTLRQAFMIALALSVLISAASLLLADPVIRLMGSQPDTHADAALYFRITMAAVAFNAVTLVINAAQRGAGNTKIAMQTNLTANLVNVAFNFLLIEGRFGFPRLEVRGAAVATAIGMAAACAMALLSVARKNGMLRLFHDFSLKPDGPILRSLLRLSLPTLGEQMVTRFGFIMYFMIIARLGTVANSAHHIGMNFISISFSLGDGLASASIALVGRRLGEKRPDLAVIYSAVCQRFGLCCSFLIALIYIPFGRQLYSLFSETPEVHRYGEELMRVIAVVVFIQISMVIFVSCLRAAGDVRYVAAMNFLCIGVIRWIVAYLLCYPAGLGLIGAWMGLLADQTLRLALSWRRYRKGKWVEIKI
jgi:putative MATE family efflux protein